MEDRVRNRNRATQRRVERKALGVCPTCGKHPATYGYVQCAPCRQDYLDKVGMKRFDAKEDYGSWMRHKSNYTWRETAEKVGLGPTQMMRHIQKGTIRAVKDPWGRLWVFRKDRNNFLRLYVRGYPYGT